MSTAAAWTDADSLDGSNLDAPDEIAEHGQELVMSLAGVRRGLLRNPAIARYLRASRGQVSGRDFAVSLALLAGGAAAGAWATLHFAWMLPVTILVQAAGLAGFTSLIHEGWHRRATPWGDVFLSRYLIQPLFLGFFSAQQEDHFRHHKGPGERADPSNGIWAMSERTFQRSLRRSLFIVPKLVDMAARMVTGRRVQADVQRKNSHRGAPVGYVALVVVHGAWAGSLLLVAPLAVVTGYVLPMAISSALTHLREYREHERLADGSSAVYDVLCHPLERLLIAGGYFNLHALHHTFPEVPQRKLPGLYALLCTAVDIDREYYGVTPRISRKETYWVRKNREPAPGPRSASLV